MNVLAIGNSFSCNANTYLYEITKASGANIFNANLVIGGCSLDIHFRNMMADRRDYKLELMGVDTGFKVSIKEALLNRAWDVVTLQQASHYSAFSHTYSPYIEALAKYVRELCPGAKIYIHQTWAYEEGSAKLAAMRFDTQAAMFEAIKDSYFKAAELISADGIIPSGETMQNLVKLGIGQIHADTFHAKPGAVKYALGLAWLETLTGKSALENSFRDFGVVTTDEEIAIAQQAAHNACALYNK